MKKLNLNLEGENGNIFNLLGIFHREARKAGWTEEERTKVGEEVASGDYEHAIEILTSV